MNISRVLIADAVDSACVKLLESNGIQVDCKYKLSENELIKELQNYDGLIVRSETKVTKCIIENSNSLKVIGRAGVGIDNIDLNAANDKKVIVLNAPGGNSISACELTCGLIINLARNVVQANASLRKGEWNRKMFSGFELYGKTLGIIGLGRIGREVGQRMQSFGMTTVGYDPFVTSEQAIKMNIEMLELEQIYSIADFITVHTPLIPSTRNLINTKVFEICKPGLKVINVARGGIIDEHALLEALNDGKCGGAALDVYEEEPPTAEVTLKLLQHSKVIGTPHLGASTQEAQVRVAVEVAEQFIALTGKSKKFTQLAGVINRNFLPDLTV